MIKGSKELKKDEKKLNVEIKLHHDSKGIFKN